MATQKVKKSGVHPNSLANLRHYGVHKDPACEPGEKKHGPKPGSKNIRTLAKRLANAQISVPLPDGGVLEGTVREAVLFGLANAGMRGNQQAAEVFFKYSGDDKIIIEDNKAASGGDGPLRFKIKRVSGTEKDEAK
jgi:hypothetical protein